MKSQDAATGRGGFTLIEMLVVMALVGMLSAVVMAAIVHARRFSIQVECQEHLRQIGQTVQAMLLTSGGAYPKLVDDDGVPWWSRVQAQWGGVAVNAAAPSPQLPASMRNFHCRMGGALDGSSAEALNRSISYGLHFDVMRADGTTHYRAFDRGHASYPALEVGPENNADRNPDEFSYSLIRNPTEFVLISEADTQAGDSARWTGGRIAMDATGRTASDDPPHKAPIVGRHGGRANVLFADMHVELIDAQPDEHWTKDINRDTARWTLEGE